MDISLFVRGIVMGVAIAAPVGPIGVLCIRQTLTHGVLTGLISGLGAATADGLYGSIAGFGLSTVSDLLVTHNLFLKSIGGLFLGYLGVKTFLTHPAPIRDINTRRDTNARDNAIPTTKKTHPPLLRTYSTTLVLTLTNPATILSFTAIFAGLGMTNQGGTYDSALLLVAGVFCGSALWWLTLSLSIGYFRHRIPLHSTRWINWISGIIITAFGIIAIASLWLNN